MKTLYKYLSLVLTALIVGAFVAGCGDDEESLSGIDNSTNDGGNNSEVYTDAQIKSLIKEHVSVEGTYRDYVWSFHIESTLHDKIADKTIRFGIGHGDVNGSTSISLENQVYKYTSSNKDGVCLMDFINPYWYYYMFGRGSSLSGADEVGGFDMYYRSYVALLNKGASNWSSDERDLYNGIIQMFEEYELVAKIDYTPSVQVCIDNKYYLVKQFSYQGDSDDSSDENNDGDMEIITDERTQNEVDARDSRRGTVSTSFEGKGTSSSPYLISSAADLRLLSDEVRAGNNFKGKYFKMTADVVINRNVLDNNGEPNDSRNFERWIPIGVLYQENFSFCGTFDGDGHSVSGIYINRTGFNGFTGLFGVVENGTIKNLTLKDSYISGKHYTSGMMGILKSSSSSGMITNCHNYASVSGGIASGIGAGDDLQVYRCSNYGKISSSGIASGISYRASTCVDCLNFGNISARSAGGIGGTVIRNCVNYGEIRSVPNADESDSRCFAGGIDNFASTGVDISNCVNIGQVSADEGGRFGAVAARSQGMKVSYCHYLTSACSVLLGGTSNSTSELTENNPCSDSEMKSNEVLNALNEHKEAGDSKWVSGADGYPILEWAK